MDKKIIAILLAVTSSCASSAFATNIVSKLISKYSSTAPSITKTHKAPKQVNGSYIDFSGTWIGNCGDGKNFTMVIENGFNYIDLGGSEFRIGQGLQGTYESNEEEAGYEHSSFEWNKDGSALIMKSVDVIKDNVDNSAIQTIMSTFSLTMKNGQINLDGKLAGFNDLTQIHEPVTVHCVFNKKQ